MSYGQRKCANDELLALLFSSRSANTSSIFFLFFSLTIKDKTKISLTIKILHLGQGSFTRKGRTIFTVKIIVSIFVKLFLILVLHLRQFFIVRIFVKRATGFLVLYSVTILVLPTGARCVRKKNKKIKYYIIVLYSIFFLFFFFLSDAPSPCGITSIVIFTILVFPVL